MASDTRPPVHRERVSIKSGFHLVDWMKLTFSTKSTIAGVTRKISRSELSKHKSQFDCWTAYKGKVYDVSQYLQYHPGGVRELMLGAGKDCTKLFDKYHPWVNADSMLSKVFLGLLTDDDIGIDPIIEEEEAKKPAADEEEKENKEGSITVVVSKLEGLTIANPIDALNIDDDSDDDNKKS